MPAVKHAPVVLALMLLLLSGGYLRSAPPADSLTSQQKEQLKEADKLNRRSTELHRQGKNADAALLALQVLEIRKTILGEEHADTATALNNLGVLLYSQGDYAAARSYDEQALKIRRKVLGEEHLDTANTLNNLGRACCSLSDYAAARLHHEQALKIRRKVLGDEHVSTAASFNNLGLVFQHQADYPAARSCYEQTLKITQKVLGNEHPSTAMALNNLGTVLKSQGDYAAARTCYEQSLQIRKKVLGDAHPDTALSLSTLGSLLIAQGDTAAARLCYEQSLEIRQKALGEEHPTTAVTLNSLGALLKTQGDYAAARPYFERALKIRKKVLGDEHPETATSLNDLGTLLKSEGDDAAARPYYEQALQIRKKVLGDNHPDTAMSLNNLGSLLENQGDTAAARPYFEQAFKIDQKVLGDDHPDTNLSLNNWAALEASAARWDVAGDLTDKARRGDRRHVARVLPGLSEKEQLLFLKRREAKQFYMSLSLGLLRRQDVKLANLSSAWLLNGKGIAQAALAERALNMRDVKNPKLAGTVQELLDVRRKLSGVTLSSPETGKEAAWREMRAQLTSQEERLSRRLNEDRESAVRPDPWVELKEVQKSLSADDVLIDIARFSPFNFQAKGKVKKWRPAHYVAWIISATRDAQVVHLGPADAIDPAVERAKKTLEEVAAKDSVLRTQGEQEAERQVRQDLQAVADLVWKPLSDKLGNARRLILSPDAALWLLPWGALPVAENRFLIEDYSITYVISGRDLVSNQKAKTPKGPAVVVANPDFDLTSEQVRTAIKNAFHDLKLEAGDQSLALSAPSTLPQVRRLPGTASEVLAIKPTIEQYTHAAPQVYVDQNALESIFKRVQHPQIAVLSTHGFFLPDQQVKHDDNLPTTDSRAVALAADDKQIENPLLRCGLLFAGCNTRQTAGGDDGILTGMEIVGIDLRGTELVVLSACETGVGQVRNGEGVAGLRQAFQLAGAEAVVATLWQIPDLESARIMNDFFTNLAHGQTKTDALHAAQLKRIASRRDKFGAAHPYFWAAFTLTGQ